MNRVFSSFRSIFLSTFLIVAGTAHSAENHEARVTEYVRAQILSQLDIEVEAIDGAVQSEVFSCTFFHAKPWLKHPDGSKESWSNYILVSQGSNVATISKPGTIDGDQVLVDCIKEGFVVVTEDDATVLMNALEGIFNNDSSSFERRVSKSEQGWRLITGEFFDDFSGYFVQTDSSGKITIIGHSLELMTL